MIAHSSSTSVPKAFLFAFSLALAIMLAMLAAPDRGSADGGCDRYASPTGNDANRGTASEPVRSVARLIAITGPGEEGCLPAGSTFDEPLGSFIVDNAGGTVTSPARIRTDDPDGAPAIVRGAMWLKAGVHDLAFERIRFIGSPGTDQGTMLVVHGDRIAFRYTEMTWRRGICIGAGYRDGYSTGDSAATTVAEGLVIEHSRIHDCGNDPQIVAALRSSDQSGVHGIYLIDTRGARISDNYIYDNISRGVQLWPDADDSVVENNVFDGNGSSINVGSSAEYGHFSENNRFEGNVVSNAVLRSAYNPPWGPGDTESVVGYFPADGSDHGNAFVDNCVYQADPEMAYGGRGYTRSGDIFGDPGYLDAANGDFRLGNGSPCAGKGPGAGGVLPGTVDPPAADPSPGTGTGHRIRRAGSRVALLLRFLHGVKVRWHNEAINFVLRSNRDVAATIVLKRLGSGGSILRERAITVRAGDRRLRTWLHRTAGRVAWYRLIVRAVDSTGESFRLTSRAFRS